jgi:hypothetical protein
LREEREEEAQALREPGRAPDGRRMPGAKMKPMNIMRVSRVEVAVAG